MKKKIIIYSTNDKYFSIPILNDILNKLPKEIDVDIYLDKPSFSRKLKVLLVFFLFSPLKDFKFIFSGIDKKYLTKNKNIKIIKKIKKNYFCGFIINHTKKVKITNYNIYNFHVGNLSNQRGSFYYFYKFKYKWSYIDLTFHKIDQHWDKGSFINSKKINIKKMSAIEICSLYKSNTRFILTNMLKVLNMMVRYKKIKPGRLNTEPSYYQIIFVYLKNFFQCINQAN